MKLGRSNEVSTVVTATAMLLLLVGCDGTGLIDETYQGEPLFVINGSLSIDAPKDGQKISIAVAWINDIWGSNISSTIPNFVGDEENEVACDGTPAPYQTETYRSAGKDMFALESSAYEATSLVSFKLPILDLPPESARNDLASMNLGEGWIAQGVFIAFLDMNGDGKFDAATPEIAGDELLAVSYDETNESGYEGIVSYLNGTISNVPYRHFEGDPYTSMSQGFNIQGLEWNDETDELKITTNWDQTIRLFTPDPAVDFYMIDLQCSEIEYHVDFDKLESVDDYGTPIECNVSQSGYASSDGSTIIPGPISIGWYNAVSDPDTSCLVHESRGFMCFPGPDMPEDWQGPCIDALDSLSDESGSADSSDSGTTQLSEEE